MNEAGNKTNQSNILKDYYKSNDGISIQEVFSTSFNKFHFFLVDFKGKKIKRLFAKLFF